MDDPLPDGWGMFTNEHGMTIYGNLAKGLFQQERPTEEPTTAQRKHEPPTTKPTSPSLDHQPSLDDSNNKAKGPMRHATRRQPARAAKKKKNKSKEAGKLEEAPQEAASGQKQRSVGTTNKATKGKTKTSGKTKGKTGNVGEAPQPAADNGDDGAKARAKRTQKKKRNRANKKKAAAAAASGDEAPPGTAIAPILKVKDTTNTKAKGNGKDPVPDCDITAHDRCALVAEIRKHDGPKNRPKIFDVPGHPQCESLQSLDYDLTFTDELFKGHVMAENSIDFGKPRIVLCKVFPQEQNEAKLYACSQFLKEPKRLKSLLVAFQKDTQSDKASNQGFTHSKAVIGEVLVERFVLVPEAFIEHGEWNVARFLMAALATAKLFQSHGIADKKGILGDPQEQNMQLKQYEELIKMGICRIDDWCDNKEDQIVDILGRAGKMEKNMDSVAHEVLSPYLEDLMEQHKEHEAMVAKQTLKWKQLGYFEDSDDEGTSANNFGIRTSYRDWPKFIHTHSRPNP